MFKTDEDVSPRRPPNFNEEDISDKPQWVDDELANPHTMDKAYQKSLRSLMSVDEAIPKLLDAVHNIDQEQNTAIIYYADNGEAWGEHRLKEAKNCPYEECTRVPLILHFPKLISESRQNDQMVLNIDLAPTIADFAGVNIPSKVDGLSLMPLLINPTADWRDQILIEHWPTDEGHGAIIPEFSAIRTKEWKYVEYINGEKELYDLVNDPYEMENLVNEIKYKPFMSVLATHLQELRED
jgi:arylsulfatase A-like enzyme